MFGLKTRTVFAAAHAAAAMGTPAAGGEGAQHAAAAQAAPLAPAAEEDLFTMGAVVAVGELYFLGMLGDKHAAAPCVRDFLCGFGVRSMEDVHALGLVGPYAEDFEELFTAAAHAYSPFGAPEPAVVCATPDDTPLAA